MSLGSMETRAKSCTNLSFGVPPMSVSLISKNTFSVESFDLKYKSTFVKNPPVLSDLNVCDSGSLLRAFNGNAAGDFLTTILSR